MKVNAIQNQTSINVISRLQSRGFFIVSLDWRCFWHVPDFSPLAMACSLSFHCLQATTSQNILNCNFTINQLLKMCKSVRVFIKQDSFFELQSEAIFTRKWGNKYKVVQYRRQMKETKEIDFDNLLLYSSLICLATDSLPLGILEKLKL